MLVFVKNGTPKKFGVSTLTALIMDIKELSFLEIIVAFNQDTVTFDCFSELFPKIGMVSLAFAPMATVSSGLLKISAKFLPVLGIVVAEETVNAFDLRLRCSANQDRGADAGSITDYHGALS